jgi:uncharacterized protein YunC (DUF1805 family)
MGNPSSDREGDMDMDPGIIIALINTAGIIIVAYLSYKTREQSRDTAAQVNVVEKATNSMKDALVEATRKASFAAGLAQGTEKERQRPKDGSS